MIFMQWIGKKVALPQRAEDLSLKARDILPTGFILLKMKSGTIQTL